jgi:hypothetical protein
MEGQVVLLSRDAGLASTIGRLLSNGDRIARYHSAELADWSTPTVATVILDSQPQARRLSYKQVRDRYHGPLIMLLDMDEPRPDLPPDGARRYLQRPFEVADLSSLLDTPVPELGPFEAAIIAAWSHRVTVEPPVPVRPRPAAQLPSWGPSPWRRARVWAATIVALVGLLLVVSLSGQGSCAPGCTRVGGPVAGAAEAGTPPTSTPATRSAGGGSGDSQPPGSSAVSSQPSTPTGATGFPVVTGVGGLIESTNPITGSDTTPTSGPVAVPGVPAPPGVGPPPTTNPPSGTTPPTTGPPATGTPTTVPATTVPATTVPLTTAPPTTEPSTTEPPTTEPPTTAPPTTGPPTTGPPTTAPPTTAPPTTAPPTTEPPTTEPPTTEPPTTTPPTTTPPTTTPPTTTPPTTTPPTTTPPTTEPPTTAPSTT